MKRSSVLKVSLRGSFIAFGASGEFAAVAARLCCHMARSADISMRGVWRLQDVTGGKVARNYTQEERNG
jgi:hypothetical protein